MTLTREIPRFDKQLWTLSDMFTTMGKAVNYEIQVRLEDVR